MGLTKVLLSKQRRKCLGTSGQSSGSLLPPHLEEVSFTDYVPGAWGAAIFSPPVLMPLEP